ncbi:MAG: dynamin family protein [Okeania sp. SIO3B5]|uniref:dynamin family protein n=1 Tax=Okeania sp. SIO3B5 TaxID=2607811 RepID=UPI0013FFC0BD|nr:dynamin family protein [Okeania sp. SIO3B5]NEO54725.1 dynamin family protein [Okeania sp. SIO3B5]
MSSKDFQNIAEIINSTGNRVLEYLQELEKGMSSCGENNQKLQEIKNEIESALNALQKRKYEVAVVAPMKAGKSTFSNSMIGADILASETAACTVCRTDVKHIPKGQIPKLLEYRDGQRKPVLLAEGELKEIQASFLSRTREIRKNNNKDFTTRFEIEHPIEAISSFSYLAGFTLVDTPGPNEWESKKFKTVSLKQTALEVLRNCNVILFVLDYTSCKDNAVSDLFKEVLEKRKELLATEVQDKVYFILNKVDQKTEKDQDIPDFIEDLKTQITEFGFPNPKIYPASSFQGLLAKLIISNKATDGQIKDFKKFFSASYARENEEGDLIIPGPKKIAPQALKDSGIPAIQETVIQTIIKNAGWNLLNDVLNKIDKSAKAIENSLQVQIKGWETEIEDLKQKVENYKLRSQSAKRKVEDVKKSVDLEKKVLVQGFSQGLNLFAETAKAKIQQEIDGIVSRSSSKVKTEVSANNQTAKVNQKQSNGMNFADMWRTLGEFGSNVLQAITGLSFIGKSVELVFEVTTPLWEELEKEVPNFNNYSSDETKKSSSRLYKIRFNSQDEAEKTAETISKFVAPYIQSWWLDTQDKLVIDGGKIRKELALKIKQQIQEISNELSDYLGADLQVQLNANEILFPDFEFRGIDAQIKYQQEVYERTRKETRSESRCCASDRSYEVDVPYKEKKDVYEIDLRETVKLIHSRIDQQKAINEELLNRVIEKQVKDDFKSAEKQINDYINRFQSEFERVLNERETREVEVPKILAYLENQKHKINSYLEKLAEIKQSLLALKLVS